MRLNTRSSVQNAHKKKNRKNNQKRYYSGKKKRHTIKTQFVVQKSTRTIICSNFANGKTHDFKLFKKSKIHFQNNQKVLVDSGYTGILKIHSNTDIPKKRTKKNPLTAEDKKRNKDISNRRIVVENIIGWIKKFHILADKYRNRRRRHSFRVNIIAAIHNYEI